MSALTVSVVIVAYESGAALPRCLESLTREAPGAEVIVVNNGSEGPEISEAHRLGAKVISAPTNIGFAAGCNLGATHATREVLLFLNPDTVVTAGAVATLAQTLADDSIGVAMPRLRLLNEPERLNSGGNVVHVAGFGWAGSYGEPAVLADRLVDVPYASGAALAIRASVFANLGRFTEKLFMYQEDLELAWRARMQGLRVVMNPDADVYHDYEYDRHAEKPYFLERNRLVFVFSSFSLVLLFVLSPVLLCAEIATFSLAARERWLGKKMAGWGWCLRNARWLWQHRRRTQRTRLVPNRDLAAALTPVIDPAMIESPAVARLANPLLVSYWRVVRRAL
jgi:GT2 family glycosyltransferase